ncbi:hypothetical protein [Luteitalea sp.]|uniref:hypothetical protein n=1 Tax=Luteitalea sp. TaxID=2004800 RepID=UPI0025BE1D56|nr:hypothetical protein [Luteitalea sp.]
MTLRLVCLALLWLLCGSSSRAAADVVLLLAEPYGRAAGFNPTGHVGVYLTRVCADTPTSLRRCRDGEVGAVVSRYNKVGDFDWAAVPLLPYLYGVTQAADVPVTTTPADVRALREAYRQAHLRDLIPDDVATRHQRWWQLIGAAYDRQFVAISVTTTAAQDDRLIEALNAGENRHRFNVLFRNCADFARDVINDHYYPGALGNNLIADLGVTTPKQVARALARYGRRHVDVDLTAFVIPQVPGHRPPSPRARGVLESFLRVKKYSIPLAAVQPWVPVGLAAGYLTTGRFNPHRLATHTLAPEDLERQARQGVIDLR